MSQAPTSTNMSRAQQFLLVAILLTAFWIYCHRNLSIFPSKVQFFVDISPLWLAVTMGSMALFNIGFHLFIFRDCPEAYKKLQKEIAAAKIDLKTKGLKM